MKYKWILAIDPSGSFNEGKGTSGICLMDHNRQITVTSISARDYANAESYWDAHLAAIDSIMASHPQECVLVVEDYQLYANKASTQINSHMETCRLLGIIQWHSFKMGYPIKMQHATEVKNRWGDSLLNKKLDLPKVNRHELDAVRHAMHYMTFRNGLPLKGNRRKKYTAVYTNFELKDE